MPSGAQITNRNLVGVGYILAGVAFLATMDSVAKALVNADYSVMQIIAIRGWIILGVLLLALPRLGGWRALKTAHPFKHVLRIIVGFAAPYFFFSSLKSLGLADATVIFFGGATFLMTALSVPFFGERVGPHRWGAVIVGFAGVVYAAQPGEGVFQIEALFAIASGASYAVLMMVTRWIGAGEGSFRPVFYYNLGLACVATLFLPASFKPMPSGDIATILAMAALAIAGQFGLTRAFHNAPIALLAPFEFTAIIWSALLGYFIWSDIPSTNVLTGGAVIVCCGLYLVHRETLAARREKREKQTMVAADPLVITIPASVETDRSAD